MWSGVLLSCLTLYDPVDCNPPGSSVHGILQARRLEWVAIPFSRGSSQPRDQTHVSCIAGRFFTVWATRNHLFHKGIKCPASPHALPDRAWASHPGNYTQCPTLKWWGWPRTGRLGTGGTCSEAVTTWMLCWKSIFDIYSKLALE